MREEAWPLVHNAEELHDALQTLGYITAAEFADNGFEKWRERLVLEGRLHQLVQHPQELLFATEDLPKFRALFPECCAQFDTPSFLEGVCFEPEEALRDLVRSRLEGLGPVTAQRLADEVSLPCVKIDAALLALEVEGFVFQGKFTPRAEQAGDGPVEWCERRLLQRIHRYTIDSHRKAIKPVSLQVYTQFLFDEHACSPCATTMKCRVLRPSRVSMARPSSNALLRCWTAFRRLRQAGKQTFIRRGSLITIPTG